MAQVFTDDNFKEEVLKSELPVLVDFFAQWCGPCKMMAPVIDELAEEFSGKFVIGKCDVDENPEVTQTYGVTALPTIKFFKDGEIVGELVGFQSKDKIAEKLNELAA
jgi:thioredoxin 1